MGHPESSYAVSRFALAVLTVATTMALATSAYAEPLSAAQSEVFDQYRCSQVRTPAGVPSRLRMTTTLADGSESVEDCVLRPKHKLLCTPARRELVRRQGADAATPLDTRFDGEALAADQVCYRARCSGTGTTSLHVADAFGERRLRATRKRMVCTPVLETVGPQ